MSLRDWQSQLGQALLLPEPPGLCRFSALQGIEGPKLSLYEELLFNTVAETLQSIYPYSYRLISDEGQNDADWLALVEQYRRAYPNQSYKLMGAVSAFPAFLAEQVVWVQKFPFLPDLALYEWLEMQVLNLPDAPPEQTLHATVPEPDTWDVYAPLWNPARQLHPFQFHVPEILEALHQDWHDDGLNRSVSDILPKPVDILIYRDPQTLEARFFCLNTLTAQLLNISSQPNQSYGRALIELQSGLPALQAVPMDIIRQQAYGLFANCLQNGMLLGSIPL